MNSCYKLLRKTTLFASPKAAWLHWLACDFKILANCKCKTTRGKTILKNATGNGFTWRIRIDYCHTYAEKVSMKFQCAVYLSVRALRILILPYVLFSHLWFGKLLKLIEKTDWLSSQTMGGGVKFFQLLISSQKLLRKIFNKGICERLTSETRIMDLAMNLLSNLQVMRQET